MANDISAREALESCLDRTAAVNPMLNAVTVDLSDAAYEAARRADDAIARGLAAAEAIEARAGAITPIDPQW